MRKLLVLLLLLVLPIWAQSPSDSALDLVEWVLKVPLTVQQRQLLSSAEGWQSWAEGAASLDQAASTNEELSRQPWLNRLLNPSTPFEVRAKEIQRRSRQCLIDDLSMQAVDSFAEWLLFAAAVSDGQTPTMAPPGPAFSQSLEATLRKEWPGLDDDSRQKFRAFPEYWAQVRQQWPTLEESERQQKISNWRKALAPILTIRERRRLASACMQDMRTVFKSQATPMELDHAVTRVENAARRMSREPDAESKKLAQQLQRAAIQVRSQQDQARALEQINQLSDEIATRSHLPMSDPDSIAPLTNNYGQVFRDINMQNSSGIRTRW